MRREDNENFFHIVIESIFHIIVVGGHCRYSRRLIEEIQAKDGEDNASFRLYTLFYIIIVMS
jgi:hypothetical protein